MKAPSPHDATPPEPMAAVQFVLPDPLLVALRERRALQRATRGKSRVSHVVHRALLSLLPSLFDGGDINAAARAYAEGLNELQVEVEQQYDAFLLDPGMGPMTYLAADGRIIVDGRSWNGEGITFETSLDMAIAAVVIGAQTTNLPDLLAIIPRLDAGSTCPWCHGNRWKSSLPAAKDTGICPVCFGRGEVDERLISLAREIGYLQ